jgi:hypothetical protein
MAVNFELSSLDTGELYKALTKAQSAFTECAVNGSNPFFNSKYALLTDLIKASRPALANNGLCVISKILHIDGEIYTVLELHHGESQQFTRCWQKLEPNKKDAHGYSSANTYWRRTMYRDLINVNCADGDDDDGNYASTSVPNNKSNSANNKLAQKTADVASNNQSVITSNQLAELEEKLFDDPGLRDDILKFYKITHLSQLKQSQFAKVI